MERVEIGRNWFDGASESVAGACWPGQRRYGRRERGIWTYR